VRYEKGTSVIDCLVVLLLDWSILLSGDILAKGQWVLSYTIHATLWTGDRKLGKMFQASVITRGPKPVSDVPWKTSNSNVTL